MLVASATHGKKVAVHKFHSRGANIDQHSVGGRIPAIFTLSSNPKPNRRGIMASSEGVSPKMDSSFPARIAVLWKNYLNASSDDCGGITGEEPQDNGIGTAAVGSKVRGNYVFPI